MAKILELGASKQPLGLQRRLRLVEILRHWPDWREGTLRGLMEDVAFGIIHPLPKQTKVLEIVFEEEGQIKDMKCKMDAGE